MPDAAEQALKAFVLVNLPEKAHHDRGKTEILDLCKRNPPITEPEAIYQMQDALMCLSLKEEEGPKIWERAVIAKQNDKDLYTRWLNQAIADSDWLSAQKVWLHGQFYECKRRRLTWGHIPTGHHGVAKIIP
jgi:N-terminal acetyltransferase B complex non-catalytic subunit